MGDINWAVVSNYLYDMDWLLKEIPKLRNIPCVSLLCHKDNCEFVLPANFTKFSPYVEQYGTHHSKFILLGYETGIRVIILTCNHVLSDHYHLTGIPPCHILTLEL